MKFIYSIFILFLMSMQSLPAQEAVQPWAMLKKGNICDITTGTDIRELIYEGAMVTVERDMWEEVYILKYTFDIMECGKVAAYTNPSGIVFTVSTIDSDLRTKEGAYVGMTVNELLEIYPKGRLIRHDMPYLMEEFGYHFFIEGLGSFIIHAEAILEKCNYDRFGKCMEMAKDLKSVKFESD